jgi:hypothetical protein
MECVTSTSCKPETLAQAKKGVSSTTTTDNKMPTTTSNNNKPETFWSAYAFTNSKPEAFIGAGCNVNKPETAAKKGV